MRILLVPDVPNWAFDHCVDAVIKHLPQFDIEKVYSRQFQVQMIGNYDLVHIMNWFDFYSAPERVSGGICSHNFELRRLEMAMKLFPRYRGLIVLSKIIYEMVKDTNDNIFYAPDGVHADMFVPAQRPADKKFVVGYVAQKTTGLDIKGYDTILLPLMKELEKYDDIEFKLFTNTAKNAVKHEQMPGFYSQVDCQVCTSFREGGPAPMLEAASCGKALISTRVGVISEFIKHGENGFIIDAYDLDNEDKVQKTIQGFVDNILALRNNKDLCNTMGKRSRELVEEGWTWQHRAKNWASFFESMI